MSSILNDTKEPFGLTPDDTSFDVDIKMFINSAINILIQLGVREKPFMVIDETALWSDLYSYFDKLPMIQSYVYYKVKLAFDPPANSVAVEALKVEIKETEWRIIEQVERTGDVDQTEQIIREVQTEPEQIDDGGTVL